MHVGGVRTALFAWALAKKHGGQFILRIEDTDKAREVEGSIQHIIDSLQWLNVDWQEGPDVGGEFGPYTQSERLDTYREWAEKLIKAGHAYIDPYTPEEVDAFRKEAQADKRPFLFRQHRPENLESPDDWYQKSALRFKTPELKRFEWHDEVRGSLSAGEDALDDFVIMKADGYPTYNFAHVVDDHLMEITHVIRGEEFIASVPKFLSLHEALQIDHPKLVTVPPILNQNGGKKLSKRDGAKDILDYRDEGYQAPAVINFLASLGWNDGSDQEVYTPEEFVAAFSLDRIQKSGAMFDIAKLDWLNWQHVERMLEAGEYTAVLAICDIEDVVKPEVLKLAATKANSVPTLREQLIIFTTNPHFQLSDENLRQVDKKLTADDAKRYLAEAKSALENLDTYSVETIESALRETMDRLEAPPRHFLNLVRWVISGSKVSPSLFEMLAAIGKNESLERLSAALDN